MLALLNGGAGNNPPEGGVNRYKVPPPMRAMNTLRGCGIFYFEKLQGIKHDKNQ